MALPLVPIVWGVAIGGAGFGVYRGTQNASEKIIGAAAIGAGAYFIYKAVR